MNPSATTVEHVAHAALPDTLGGVSMQFLGAMRCDDKHPGREVIETECSQGCGARFEAMRYFAPITACDACRDKAIRADRLDKAKAYWEAVCPPAFRDTDRTHAMFPKAQYEELRPWVGDESLLLFGDSRTGKTRLAMLLLKRCLVRKGLHVGVLWPEQLKAMKKSFQPLEDIAKWGRYDVLLMDDSLLTAASDSRLTEVFKDLLDYRMRFKRVQIITSQIGSDDYKEQSGKFSEATGADKKLIEALCERVREICRVVPFVKLLEPKIPIEEQVEAF